MTQIKTRSLTQEPGGRNAPGYYTDWRDKEGGNRSGRWDREGGEESENWNTRRGTWTEKGRQTLSQMTQNHDSERLAPPLTIEISLSLWILVVICGMSAGLLGLLSWPVHWNFLKKKCQIVDWPPRKLLLFSVEFILFVFFLSFLHFLHSSSQVFLETPRNYKNVSLSNKW